MGIQNRIVGFHYSSRYLKKPSQNVWKGNSSWKGWTLHIGSFLTLVFKYIVCTSKIHNIIYLRSWINWKFQFGPLIEIHRESLHKHRCETRSSASSKGMKHQKSLKTCAVFCHLTNSVQSIVDNFFANSIVAASIIICSVFLSCDQLRWMEKFFVGSGTDFIWNFLTWQKLVNNWSKDFETRLNEDTRKKKYLPRLEH